MSQFQWTGNPFVDTGLAVIIARAKGLELSVNTIADLTPEIIEKVAKSQLTESSDDFSWLTTTNRKLNSYTMIFSSNNPLTNASTNLDLVLDNNKKKTEQLQGNIAEAKSKLSSNSEQLKKAEDSLLRASTEKDRKKGKAEIEKLKREKKKLESSIEKLQKQTKELEEKKEKHQNKKAKQTATADQGLNEYKNIMQELLADIRKEATSDGSICEATGIFNASNALQNLGKSVAKEWFPLAGTLSDAQSLPSSSRALKLSALSLLAAQFLPIGVAIIGKRLVCFQTNDYAINDVPIFQIMVENIFNETSTKANIMDKVETWGKGNAYSSISLLLLGHLTALEQKKVIRQLPNWICLNLWLFSNSGTEPALEIIDIPNESLQFLWEAYRGAHRDELERYLRAEEDFENKLLECIKDRREYFPFYPNRSIKKKVSVDIENLSDTTINELPTYLVYDKEKHQLLVDRVISTAERTNLLSLSSDTHFNNSIKTLCAKAEYNFNRKASIELFELYMVKVMGYSKTAMEIAKWIAVMIRNEQIDLESLFQPVDFQLQLETYKSILSILAQLTEKGFGLEHYLLLFPSLLHPLRNDPAKHFTACRIIGFYVNCQHIQNQELPMIHEISQFAHPKYSKIKSFAQDFFEFYLGQQGRDRFEKRILNELKRERISPGDVENWFASLADIKAGYTNEEWDDLCRDENGDSEVWEVIFQLRLELANLYRLKYQNNNS